MQGVNVWMYGGLGQLYEYTYIWRVAFVCCWAIEMWLCSSSDTCSSCIFLLGYFVCCAHCDSVLREFCDGFACCSQRAKFKNSNLTGWGEQPKATTLRNGVSRHNPKTEKSNANRPTNTDYNQRPRSVSRAQTMNERTDYVDEKMEDRWGVVLSNSSTHIHIISISELDNADPFLRLIPHPRPRHFAI